MPRNRRFAPPGYNLHITQRGNYGQQTFFGPHDHRFFLGLVAEHADTHAVDVLAYCLMPNHFHLILHGHQSGSISDFMQAVNGQYGQAIHARLFIKGRFWQDRYYSGVLDNAHLVAALRYVELNPVRAGMVSRAVDYQWSSASVHVGDTPPPKWLKMSTFHELFTPEEWRRCLVEGQTSSDQFSMRTFNRQTSGVVGSLDFVRSLEATFRRKLQAGRSGRPRVNKSAAG